MIEAQISFGQQESQATNLTPEVSETGLNYLKACGSVVNNPQWKQELDKALPELAFKCKKDWKKIQNKISKSTSRSKFLTLKTWFEELNGNLYLPRRQFSHENNLLIARLQREHSNNWELIASQIPFRIKNHFYNNLRKKKRLGSLLAEIDARESPKE